MSLQTLLPYVLALIINSDQEILLGLRKKCDFFADYYGLPGGKIQDQETPRQALVRELFEELGIVCEPETDLEFAHVMPFMGQTRPCVIFVFKIVHWQGKLYNKEPNKCKHLAWYSINALPAALIPRHQKALEHIFKKVTYSEDLT